MISKKLYGAFLALILALPASAELICVPSPACVSPTTEFQSIVIDTGIIPATVNTADLGSSTLPFRQSFFGESSTLYGMFGWSSVDTNHHFRLELDSTNRTLAIIDKANTAFNYATANAGSPTIKVYSVNQNQTQWTSLSHNGTDAVITTGTGGLQLIASGSPSYMWLSGGSFIQAPAAGGYNWSSTSSANGTADTFLTRPAAATIQLGTADAASPVAQTLQGQGSRGGTDSNVAAPSFTVRAGAGTGNSAGTKLAIQRSLMGASGTTAQTRQDAFVVCESKTLSNTSATTTALTNVAVASGSQGSARVTISVQCTNGTEVASSAVTSYQSFANKAGTIAFGTATTQTESNGASTGATINCTVAPTWTASGNSVNVNVTPIITGAATTTVGFVNIENLSAGAVTCL